MSGSDDFFTGRANRPAGTDDLARQTGEHWTPPAPEVPPTRNGIPPDLDGQPDHGAPVPDDGTDGGKPGLRRRLRGGLILRIVLVAAVLGGGSVWGALQAADRDGAGAIVDSGDVASDELRVGDCLNEPDSVEFEKIAGVPCSDEHEVEVFHVYTLDAAAYPTDDEFFASVVTECLEPFDTYVGIPYDASALDFSFYAPVEEAWDAGNNTVVCVLYELDGSLMTGSMRDAAR